MNKKKTIYESEELNEISLSTNINNYTVVIKFIVSFIILSVIISAIIKYPEKILGSAIVVSGEQVNNIYSPNSGEINIFIKENNYINAGQLLALINNPTNYSDLMKLKNKLNIVNLNEINLSNFKFEKNLKLGEIEKYYYNFLLSLIEYESLIKIDVSGQRIENLRGSIIRNKEKLQLIKSIKKNFDKKKELITNSFEIDSSLFKNNAIVKDKIDNSRLNVLNTNEQEMSLYKNNKELIYNNEELQGEIKLHTKEKEKAIASVLFNLKKTFFELKTAIDFWEYSYVIKSPVSGKIEFYQPFLNSTQYIKKDEPLFILLPKANNLRVRGIMSANGYGKIKILDTVFIKLKDYPYEEFGELTGVVNNKSKVYHDSIYFIDISLPKGLKTNHNKTINFSYNMAGQVEYFTNKRSVLERIFNGVQNAFEQNEL